MRRLHPLHLPLLATISATPRTHACVNTHTHRAHTHHALSLTLCSPSNSLSPLGARTPTEQVLCQGAHIVAKLAPWRRLTSTSHHHGDQQSQQQQQQQRWHCHQPSLPVLPSRSAGPQELGDWWCGLQLSCCKEPGLTFGSTEDPLMSGGGWRNSDSVLEPKTPVIAKGTAARGGPILRPHLGCLFINSRPVSTQFAGCRGSDTLNSTSRDLLIDTHRAAE